MGSESKTPIYGFNQWAENEYPKRQDFVDDNAKAEAALKALADSDAGKLPLIKNLTEDTNPDSTDYIATYDTASGTHRKVLLGAIGIWMKSVLDLAYAPISHTHTKNQISDFPSSMPPTAHKSTHAAGGTDALAPSDIGAAPESHKHPVSDINNFPTSMTPTAHAASHKTGGSDALAPSDIGAAKALKKTATLAVANWAGSAAPYSYVLSDADILATDAPFVDRVTGTDSAAAALINTAWGLITGNPVKPQTAAGQITFYATAKPSVNIPIQYEVVRA